MRKLLCTWKFELKLCFVIVQNSSAVFKFLFKGQWNRPRLNYCYYCSVDQSCQIPWDPKDCSTPGFPVLQHLSGLAQTHVHWWVDDAIQPSYPLSSPSPPAFSLAQHQGLLQWVSSSHGQSIGASASASVLLMDGLDLLAVQRTLKSLLQHHSSKASILWGSAFFMVQLSHPYMTAGETIAWTRWILVSKVMSLLLNMLSRLVITFLPRGKHLLIPWLQLPSAVILEPRKIGSDTVSTVSPSISHEVMGLDAMILGFWMLSFQPAYSLSLRGSLVLLHFLP